MHIVLKVALSIVVAVVFIAVGSAGVDGFSKSPSRSWVRIPLFVLSALTFALGTLLAAGAMLRLFVLVVDALV